MEKLTKREKVMLAIGLVGATAAGIVIYKQHDIILKALLDKVKTEKILEEMNMENQSTKEKLDFIEFLVIESDCVPKALQNAENKLARKETKIKELVETLRKCPNKKEIIAAIEKHQKEATILRIQIDKAMQLKDLVDFDENIYAK